MTHARQLPGSPYGSGAYDPYDDDDDVDDGASDPAAGAYGLSSVVPGERIGALPVRRRGAAVLRLLLAITIVGGSGWVLLDDQARWRDWVPAGLASLDQNGAPKPTLAPEPAKAAVPPPEAAAVEPPPAAPPVAVAITEAVVPPEATAMTVPEAAEPPSKAAPLGDPIRKRAQAAGLHPDLARVLLMRLTADDFRNAAIAVEKAVAETSDTEVFVWPKTRKPDLAQFQVRFVAGAGSSCRRYVVEVIKDNWVTTALPMEKCGAAPARQQRRE